MRYECFEDRGVHFVGCRYSQKQATAATPQAAVNQVFSPEPGSRYIAVEVDEHGRVSGLAHLVKFNLKAERG